MAARSPRIGLYDQRTNPQGQSTPYIRPVEQSTGIGASLAKVGEGFHDLAQSKIYGQQVDQQIEEDDARVYVSRAMADARAQATQIQRRALSEAPDGWRGVTQRVSQEWGQLRQQALEAAPTDSAHRFLSEAFDSYQPALLEDSANQEYQARQSWRVDTVSQAIQTEGSAIAANPSLYGQSLAQQTELINGMGDLSAHQRRALLDAASEQFSTSAVSAMVQADPHGALRLLNDEHADGPVAALSGAQRRAFVNQAQSEIDRRLARARSDMEVRISGAAALWEHGGQPVNPPSIEQVRSVLGENRARAYEIDALTFQRTGPMQSMTNSQLAEAIQAPIPTGGSDSDQLAAIAHQAAAHNVLQMRLADPMGYAVNQGLVADTQEMSSAIQSGDFAEISARLRNRTAVAGDQFATRGIAPQPLTNVEASQMRTLLDRLPADARVAALSQLRSGTMVPRGQGGQSVYPTMLSQIYGDAPAAQAGASALTMRGSIPNPGGAPIQGAQAGELMLRGEALLNPPSTEVDEHGRPVPNMHPQINMPSAETLDAAFRSYVGDAYANDTAGYNRAFQAFRAYYAGAGDARGLNINSLRIQGGTATSPDDAVNDLAGEAARAAVGAIRQNSATASGLPRNVYLPWGWDEPHFMGSLRGGWSGIQAAYPGADLSGDPADYNYAYDAGGYYRVFKGSAPLRDEHGRPVLVRPRALGDQ